MLPVKYDNLDSINEKITKHVEPMYSYISSFKLPVLSITVSVEYYETLVFLLQQKRWEEFILNRDIDVQLPNHLAIMGPHGLIEIKRKVD